MKQKPITVHFVCRGNTYRSRLAAAYFATLARERFMVTSSGIAAAHTGRKTVETYTVAVAKTKGLSFGIAEPNTQTSTQLLDEAEVLIFMNKDVYDEALRVYGFDTRKAQVWHVADVDPELKRQYKVARNEQALTSLALITFEKIRKQCDELYEQLTHTAWVDVVDAQNHATGLRLPMGWVTDRGLWHRGIHVVVQTHDGKFVVGKRVNNIVFAPGMLEISLGGGIDTGELPLDAAVRETYEELGLRVPSHHFRPLFTTKQVGYHPHFHKTTKAHLYVYAVTLPAHSRQLSPQPEEVAEVRLLTKRQVKHVLRTHRMEHFGRLKWGYKLYAKAVAYALSAS